MKTKKQEASEIFFTIRRYDPESGGPPFWQAFTLRVAPGMTVLDGLREIKETQDPSLAVRYSCRMGICGSCAMLINGRPGLACNTQILETTGRVLSLAPLPNFDIVKDLVPDLTPMFEKHRSVQPYLQRTDPVEMENPTREYDQSEAELVGYLQFSFCIRCGACMAACPTLATDIRYLGPMPLAQAHRYNADSRDGGFESRKKVVGSGYGAFRCHFAGECSRVCPKGVDPARAIQFLKRQLVMDYLRLSRRKAPSPVIGAPEKRLDLVVPRPPAPTVEGD